MRSSRPAVVHSVQPSSGPAVPPSRSTESAHPLDRSTARPHDRISPSARPKKRHLLRWIFLPLVAVVLVLTVPAAIALTRAASSAFSAKSAVNRMAAAIQARDFETASAEVEIAKQSLSDARIQLGNVGFWRNAPYVGNQIRALEGAADAGRQTLEGVAPLFLLARDIMGIANGIPLEGEIGVAVAPDRSFMDLAPEEKRAILSRIDRALPSLLAAREKIGIALDAWNRIPQNDLAKPIRAALAPVADGLPKLKRSLDEAVPLMQVALPLMGYPSPSDYVVVLQNDDEIRATGGFLGTVGKLEVDAGEIKTFAFDDVYNLDNPASGNWSESGPSFMTERMNMPKLFFRDANYTPDFPTSAARLLDFYVREVEAGTGKKPSTPTGLIALNPPVFEELLRLTGPIMIDGYAFEADTYFDILEYQVEVGFLEQGIPRNKRKELVSKLGDELLKRLTQLPASRWPDLLDTMTRALDRRQIQIYATDPTFLARLDALGWTGRVRPTAGDYLWVVDTNIVALKTDSVMEKNIAYDVDATDPENVRATVTLTYKNRANEKKDFKTTRYRDYVRVYAPEGSTFISSSGAMFDDPFKTGGVVKPGRVDVMKELGKTVFGAYWSIEPGETRTLTFTYRLPGEVGAQIASGAYRLDWQKQSGNDSATLTLNAAFGKTLNNAVPPEDRSQWGDASYRVTATSETDQTFNVKF